MTYNIDNSKLEQQIALQLEKMLQTSVISNTACFTAANVWFL